MALDESDRLSRVEALLEVQQRQIDQLTAENAQLRSRPDPEPAAPDGSPEGRTVGRRRLLVGGATAVTALDAQARVRFSSSHTTNLVLDVVGYDR